MRLRLHASKTVAALKRIIPGDYSAVCEAVDPTLSDAGFDFSDAVTGGTWPVAALMLGEKISEAREPVAGVLRAAGAWVIVLDPLAVGASSVWAMAFMDYPERFVNTLGNAEGPPILLRRVKAGWIVAVNGVYLKNTIKHGRRNC